MIAAPELQARLAKSEVRHISPMLVVADMLETIRFYEIVLGFEPLMESPGYAILGRNGQTLHLTKAHSEKVLTHTRGHTEIYLEVTNIVSLWEHVKTFKDRYQIRDLFEQPYGMTEFHIGDPNGVLVFVGERTAAKVE